MSRRSRGDVLNAANEVAVEAFLAVRSLPAIASTVETLNRAGVPACRIGSGDLEGSVMHVDGPARQMARSSADLRYNHCALQFRSVPDHGPASDQAIVPM